MTSPKSSCVMQNALMSSVEPASCGAIHEAAHRPSMAYLKLTFPGANSVRARKTGSS